MFKSIANTGMIFLTASILLATMIFQSPKTQVHQPEHQAAGPSFDGATGWLNTHPLSISGFRGKVLLVDFCTYTCINWRRTLPYVRAWASKYKDQGLVVIGIHTPEFSFEYKPENVNNTISQMNIGYPVAADNNYDIWNSFQNHYWPALYLIDTKGNIAFQKFGEGDYENIEVQIQKLLKETNVKNIPTDLVALQPQGFEVSADWDNLQSPENYLGYDRSEGFASPEKILPDKQISFSQPALLKLNQWALSGLWMMGKENVRLSIGQGKIIYRFHARDLHLIMGMGLGGHGVKFRVLIDGQAPKDAHGLDIDSEGYGTVKEHRMYQFIRQKGTVIDREFQIEFFETGVEAFDFTFG
jgi:thiol-disulfide isomerase/thioredoxin